MNTHPESETTGGEPVEPSTPSHNEPDGAVASTRSEGMSLLTENENITKLRSLADFPQSKSAQGILNELIRANNPAHTKTLKDGTEILQDTLALAEAIEKSDIAPEKRKELVERIIHRFLNKMAFHSSVLRKSLDSKGKYALNDEQKTAVTAGCNEIETKLECYGSQWKDLKEVPSYPSIEVQIEPSVLENSDSPHTFIKNIREIPGFTKTPSANLVFVHTREMAIAVENAFSQNKIDQEKRDGLLLQLEADFVWDMSNIVQAIFPDDYDYMDEDAEGNRITNEKIDEMNTIMKNKFPKQWNQGKQ